MTINRILTAVLLFGCAIKAMAQECDLKLEVEAGIVARQVLVARVYIRNTGHSDLFIPTGDVVEKCMATGSMAFIADVKKTDAGEPLKPTPREVDIIMLRPNELVELYTMKVPYQWGDKIDLRFSYKVRKALAEYYNIWAGEIETHFSSEPK